MPFDLDYLLSLEDEDQLYNEIADQFNEITGNFYAVANLELLKHLRLKGKIRVLDLACGTGHLAIEIARRIPESKVVGVDLSPLMIARAEEDAVRAGVNNVQFLSRNIHEILSEFKSDPFDVGISCFALSYLGCDFLLEEFRQLLKAGGQVGITTSSLNSLVEWQPIFFELLTEYAEQLHKFGIQNLPDKPINAQDFQARLEKAGFSRAKVKSLEIPLKFASGREGAVFLLGSGWASNFFYGIRDKALRREVLNSLISRLEAFHGRDSHLATNIEFLVGWNEV